MARYQRPKLNIDANDLWSAACAAYRINGKYTKVIDDDGGETNRQIVDRLLADTSLITEADRAQGEQVRKYYQAFTFKVLQGKKLSEFENNAMVISNRDIIEDTYDVAVVTSLPASYQRGIQRDIQNRKLENASGGFIGNIGNRVKIDIEVVRSSYSPTWNVYFISGITSGDQAVFFSYREPVVIGKSISLQGTVKAHRENSTQLNRVKMI